jgi:nucleotide-binding universal stress UspA family protein
MKILLAIDGSGCSERAVDEVARRPWPDGSQIKIISAVSLYVPVAPDPIVLYVGYRDELLEAERRRARAALDGAVEKLRAGGGARLQVATKVIEGNPKRAIIEEAESWGADLVVVGSHGYTGVRRWLLGSVAHAVVSHAPCSVEIIR